MAEVVHDDDCPRVEVTTFGEREPRYIYNCGHRPDPTPAELARQADRQWLEQQRRLAEDR